MFGLSDSICAIMEKQYKKKEGNGMNAINTGERKADNSVRKNKFWSTLKKVLLYTIAAVAVVVGLAILYQILEFLFVGVILFLAWICPKRWW